MFETCIVRRFWHSTVRCDVLVPACCDILLRDFSSTVIISILEEKTLCHFDIQPQQNSKSTNINVAQMLTFVLYNSEKRQNRQNTHAVHTFFFGELGVKNVWCGKRKCAWKRLAHHCALLHLQPRRAHWIRAQCALQILIVAQFVKGKKLFCIVQYLHWAAVNSNTTIQLIVYELLVMTFT